jgi:YHYH protein/Secretion system C-terminal sorting domain
MKTLSTFALVLISAYSLALGQLTPTVTAWQLNRNGATGYNGIIANVQKVQYSSSSVYVNASGVPSYTIGPWRANPNTAGNQNKTYKIPLTPQVQSGTKTSTGLGRIAVETNGVAVYNAKDAMSYQNGGVWNQNAIFVEAVSFDACLGHPDMSSTYHHHQSPKCGYSFSPTQHSPIIGFSFDGYPIYGPYAYTSTTGVSAIKRIVSSYRQRTMTTRRTLAGGTMLSTNQFGPDVSTQYPLGYYIEDFEFVRNLGDLDEYNGRFAITPEYPQGTYAYYATIDESGNSAYPYMIGPQYYGVVERTNTGMGQVIVNEPVTDYTGVSNANLVFSATPSTIAFGTVNVGAIAVRTYAIQAASLETGIVIIAPSGFTLSTAQNGTFTQTLTLSPSNGAIAQTSIFVRFAPTQTGTFSGTITQTAGATTLTPISVSATAQVQSSVRSQSSSNLVLYPNPATSSITLEMPNNIAGNVSVSILTLLGERLNTRQILAPAGNLRVDLECISLPPGAYFLEVQRGTERCISSFVKY